MSPIVHRLHQRILATSERRLSFAEVMETALYDAIDGYYGRGPRHLGRSGDFFTSVSVGSLFGKLLADFSQSGWPSSDPVQIIEQGGHDGQLAEDLLRALPAEAHYTLVEPASTFRSVQKARLHPAHTHQVNWVPSLESLPPALTQAMFVCNELIDAFPVHVVRWTNGQWFERCVVANDDGSFGWIDAPPASAALRAELDAYPTDLPDGFITEVNVAMVDWVRSLASTPFRGRIVIADYGLDTEELFHPSRSAGTLRRYRAHQTDDDILSDLGDWDLTTHIHFTRLIQEAQSCGLTVESYEDQGRWLTRIAAPWLMSLEGGPPDAATRSALRQFQTLTHPQFMGRSFRVLVLVKSCDGRAPRVP